MILLHAVRLERVLAGLLLTASLAGAYSLRRERLTVDALVDRRQEQLTLLHSIESRDRPDTVAPTELVAMVGLFPGLQLVREQSPGGMFLGLRSLGTDGESQ
ncbi:MAG TPA: hypothetical protein VFZ65_04830 [Planctomycetota bacterium]|nr:hypothetical protein [Planctomycetota bacterium]